MGANEKAAATYHPRESADDPGRCVCCDLPLTSCGKYTEELRAAERRAVARKGTGREREAEFSGICADCMTPFPVGTLIEYDEDAGGWRSLGCCP